MPNGEQFDYDVFISYSHRDSAWIKDELLPGIERAGLRAYVDYRNFTPGMPSLKNMERGVLKCHNTLLVLTPDYIQSGWCEIENLMAGTLDPANRELRWLPLLRAECGKPLRIAAFTHIDFTPAADHDLAWRQLLTALGKPPAAEAPTPPERAGWRLIHPYPMPPHFTGRVDEQRLLIDLARLHAATGHPAEALRLAEEARHIAARCGYVLQGADAHLELAKPHLSTDRPATRHHAEEALRLATCDGPPDYTYHAAYQEALGLLAQLGER